MDEATERLCKKSGFSFAMACVGRFLLLYKERYLRNPEISEIIDFCVTVMFEYDGNGSSENIESFISPAIEKVHHRYYALQGVWKERPKK